MATTTSNKRKKAVVATVAAAALLLGGTFAWTSISQQALNEAIVDINPGGRLHDDFNGTNKDVYVENFNTDVGAVPIFARVRLTEYVELGPEAGDKSKSDGERNAVSWPSGELALEAEPDTWQVYKPGTADELTNAENISNEYWTLQWGNDADNMPYYLPTFNKNKDSLAADINGTYDGTVEGDIVHYDDYILYDENSAAVTGTEVVDWDENAIDEEDAAVPVVDPEKDPFGTEPYNIKETPDVEHEIAQVSSEATVMTMQEWLDDGYGIGPYWVYDEDGWAYWAQPIEPGTTTGLFIDGIQMHKVPDENWYYGLNVIGQFATASDIDIFSQTDNGTTGNADYLLDLLTGEEEQGGGGEENPDFFSTINVTPDGESSVSGGEWIIFDGTVYDENGDAIAYTDEITFDVTDQDGNPTNDGTAAAAAASGFTTTYMEGNDLFVADTILETDIEKLIVTASYEAEDGTTYTGSHELEVTGRPNPLSITLTKNGQVQQHLLGANDPVYQTFSSRPWDDTFAFGATLNGGETTDITWTIVGIDGQDITEPDEDGYIYSLYNEETAYGGHSNWAEIPNGTQLARIHQTTGEFDILLGEEYYPGSMTFHILATTTDGTYTDKDILFLKRLDVNARLYNADADDEHNWQAVYTKGETTTLHIGSAITRPGVDGDETITGKDAADLMTNWGLYVEDEQFTESSEPLDPSKYTISEADENGIRTVIINETVDETTLLLVAKYNYGKATPDQPDGIYESQLRIQEKAVYDATTEVTDVIIRDGFGETTGAGTFVNGERQKLSFEAETYNGDQRVYSGTVRWTVSDAEGQSVENVTIKNNDTPYPTIWILGETAETLKITATHHNDDGVITKSATYILTAEDSAADEGI